MSFEGHVSPNCLVTWSGSEQVFECATTHKRKVYLNPDTGLWYCFVCGKGGSTHPAIRTATSTIDREYYQPHAVELDSLSQTEVGIVNSLLRPRGVYFSLAKELGFVYDRRNARVGLINHRGGSHWYAGRMRTGIPKYQSYGPAGYVQTRCEWAGPPKRIEAILCEGMFDWVTMCKIAYDLATPEVAYDVTFLAGNRPPREIIVDLVGEEKYQRVWVAFDNDQIEAAARMRTSLLCLQTEALTLLPPTILPTGETPKDWDEAFACHPEWTEDYIAGRLRS